MKVLAIETSCDETSVSVVEKKNARVNVLSQTTSSSLPEHAKIGGIIPEKAARRQLEYLILVVVGALDEYRKGEAQEVIKDMDLIAVTQGPGLIGSLLVGVECAKTLSYVYGVPLVPVNHLLAHLYANFIGNFDVKFPFVGLIASGGHTDLLFFESHEKYRWLGGTRDDAVGEALDKIGRLLGLPYPGGPEIERRAQKANGDMVKFQSPLLHSDDFDFSYSGLKSEAARYIEKHNELSDKEVVEISFAVQNAAIDVLVDKTIRAAKDLGAKSILVGGGVAANGYLRMRLEDGARKELGGVDIYFPGKKYTGDNAAMVGAYACFHGDPVDFRDVKADPELYFG